MEAVQCNHCQKKFTVCGSKKHELLTHMKILYFQVCERIFKTINKVKKHEAECQLFSGMASALKETAVT